MKIAKQPINGENNVNETKKAQLWRRQLYVQKCVAALKWLVMAG